MQILILVVVAAVAVVALALVAVLAMIVAGIRADERQLGLGRVGASGCQVLARRVVGTAAPAGNGRRRPSPSPSSTTRGGSR